MSAYPYHDKDLSQLPAPSVLEVLDYEQLLSSRKIDLNALYPLVIENGKPVLKQAQLIETDNEAYWKIPLNSEAGLYYLDLESDPATRILQSDTYRELLVRQRINEAAVSGMVAYSKGTDLDVLAVNYGVTRLTVIPADKNTTAVMEDDEAFRKRILLAIEGYARGASKGWYMFNALSAHGKVKDVSVFSPVPCEIIITVLSHDGDGTASPELLGIVDEHIKSRYIRVLGDIVTVKSAEIIHYQLDARVTFYPGPGVEPVMSAIRKQFDDYRKRTEIIGHSVYDSAIDDVLQQPGVYHAEIVTPQLPILINDFQAAYCTGFTLAEVRNV